MRERTKNKKNIILVCTAVITAVLSIILPEILISYKTKSLENVALDVPEEYYPTSSYYEVTKEFSEKLSEYQKRQLISGAWDSEISEVDKDYYEDMGYHVQENAKRQINDFHNKGYFPGSIESSYQQWYNWKCNYLQALDLNFRTYAGFFWKTTFSHYEDKEYLTIYQMTDYRIIKMIYSADNIKSQDGFELRTDYSLDEGLDIASMMFGQDIEVIAVRPGTEKDFSAVTEYLKTDKLTADLLSEESATSEEGASEESVSEEGVSETAEASSKVNMSVMVVTIQDARDDVSDSTDSEYYLCIRQSDTEYSIELIPTE